MTRALFRAFRHREYRLFYAAFAVNQIGFWVSHISLQGLTADLSGNDPFQLGLLFFFLFTPAFFFGPFAGVAADRFDRKAIVLGANFAIAALMLLLGAAALMGVATSHLVLLLAFLIGTCFTFGNPAGSALAANIVEVDDLASAVSLQSATNNLTRVLGPALAAPLLARGQFAVAFGLFAAASLAAASLVARVRVPRDRPRTAEAGGVLARIRGGLAHARERRPAVAALLTVGVLALFGVSHVALLPVFAEKVLGRQETFAWLVAMAGFGAMFGAVVTGRRARPTLRNAALSFVVYALALGGFALSRTLPWALVAQFVVGYCYFSVMTGLQTLLQQIVDDTKRGRIMSLFQMAWAGLVPFGALAMGSVAGPFGVVPTLLATATVCLLFALGMLLRALRNA